MAYIQKSIIHNLKSVYKWSTATRLRKILSSILAVLILLTSIRFIFLKPKEVKAADLLLGFNEGYGSTTNDNNQAASAVSITGATWKTEDLCNEGKCLFFDNDQDFVSITDAASNGNLDFASTESFTIGVWFRHAPVTAQDVLIAKNNYGTTAGGYRIQMESDGTIGCEIDDDDADTAVDDQISSTARFDDNKWHFVSCVKSSTTSLTLYVDANQVAQKITLAQSTTLANSDTFYVGINGDGTSLDYNGFIDVVKVYRSARTADEIKADYAGASLSRGTSVSFEPDWSYLSNGLVGYWPMEETTANTCTGGVNDTCDKSGNALDLSWNNQTASTTGKFGNGLTFDGTDDDARISDNSTLEPGTDMAISFWVNFTSLAGSGYDTVIMKAHNGSPFESYDISYVASTSKMQFYWVNSGGTGVSAVSAGTVSAGNWYHVVGVRNNGNLQVFVNGTGGDPVATTGTIFNSDNPFVIGSDLGSSDSQAKVDEVRIYNRALSDKEIQSLHNWAPGPLSYLKFDENTGTSANDSSTYANNGSIGGTTSFIPGKFGSGLKFDGSTSYVDAGSASSLDQLPHLTAEAWVYMEDDSSDGNAARIIGKNGNSTNAGWTLQVSTNRRLQFRVIGGATTTNLFRETTANLINNNTWYHIAVTWTGDMADYQTAKIYINGVEAPYNAAGSTNGASRDDDSTFDLCVGAKCPTSLVGMWDGTIDDVKVYNYVRTTAQVVEDMNGGHPAPGSPIGSSIGHWKFDEGADNTCANGTDDACNSGSQGSTLDGAQSGMALPATTTSGRTNIGKFSKAFVFDGTNDYVQIDDTSSLDITGDFTLSAWVARAGGTNAYIISKFGTSAGGGYAMLHGNSGEVYCRTDNGTSYNESLTATGLVPSDSSWHHVAAVRSGSSCRVYVDGHDRTNTVVTHTTLIANALPLRIGVSAAATPADYFNGKIDEPKVYNFALTPQEVLVEYNAGASALLGASSTDSSGNASFSAQREYCPPGNTEANCAAGLDPSPVGHWKLDENSGTSAFDTSQNNNTGTLTNSPIWGPGKSGSGIHLDPTTSNKYITVPSSASLDNMSQFTIEGWVYPVNLSNNRTFISKGVLSLYVDTISGGLRTQFFLNCSGATDLALFSTSDDDLTLNEWHHIAATWDGTSCLLSSAKVYIDGKVAHVHINSDNGAGSKNSDAGSALILGNYSTLVQQFEGNIDEVRVFNYARTPAQIAWDYSHSGGQIFGFRMDEGTGDTLNNSGSYGSAGNGDLAGATTCPAAGACPTWSTSGKYNNALSFDNTDDFVSFTNINFPTGDFSISAWVNSSGTTNDTIFSGHIASGGDELKIMENSSNQIDVQIDSTTSFVTTNTISNNVWNHIVVTRSGSIIKVYINGSQDPTTGTDGDVLNFETCEMIIGKDFDAGCTTTGVSPYGGLIDDLHIFGYALSSKQIQLMYDEGASTRFAPNEGNP